MPTAEETYGFHLYGTKDPTYGVVGHFPALQVTDENRRRLSYVVQGGIIDERLCWSGPTYEVQTAEIGDWVIGDMAGSYKACEKEIFEISFVRVV